MNDKTIPGLSEARRVQATIKRLGIQDVELFFDPEIKVWGVCQVRKTNTGIITMDNLDGTRVDQTLMWWIVNDKSEYRVPSDQDIQSIIATVHRADYWFNKGGDALADELDKQDAEKRLQKEQRHKERLQPHIKPLKRAIRSLDRGL